MKSIRLTILFLMIFVSPIYGQYIDGKVYGNDGTPLPGVIIKVEPLGKYTVTDVSGNFGPIGVSENMRLTVSASFLGYSSVDTNFNVGNDPVNLSIILQERGLDMEQVTVLGKEGGAGLGSSTEIRKSAIAHVQPNSLKDVLQLLPGQLAFNPSVNSPQQILIRQLSTNTSGNAIAQMGTSVVIDGSPLSNDANMQHNVNILNSSPGSSPPFQSVAGQGVDLRQIPADQIEKVEVIRGIAPAKFGNFTSGAVLVETRIGEFSPELRVRANPNTLQVGFGAGKRISNKNQAVSLDLDYIDSRPDPRDILNSYSRLTASMAHEIRELFSQQLSIKSRLALSGNVARRRQDDGNDPAARAWDTDERSIRFNTTLNYIPQSPWVDKIEANFAYTYSKQDAFFRELITTNVGPRPIFTKDTTGAVPYGSARYLNETTVNGKVINYYHRMEAVKSLKIGSNSHKISFGTEWRADSNEGEGRMFDPTRPPRQNYSAGDRPRSFSEVPNLNQTSFYLEDRFSSKFVQKPLFWQVGLRADHYFLSGSTKMDLGTSLQPRINLLWQAKESFAIRGGYGILSKIPGLHYLSPGPRFIDMINFNHYATNPAERLVVVTTRKINIPDGQMSYFNSNKWEFGLEGKIKNVDFLITMFREKTDRAPSFVREPYLGHRSQFEVLEYPEGSPPVLGEQVPFDTLFLAYDRPFDNQFLQNIGLEYVLDFPEIKSLRTSINVSGAFIHSKSHTTGNQVDNNFIFRHTESEYIPYYNAGIGDEASQFNSSIRLIHRLPAAGLVVSALVQVIWIQSDRPVGYNPLPIALLDRSGSVRQLTAEESALPEYERYRREVLDRQLLRENRPPLLLLNLRLNKEFSKGRGFAFYVNNLVDHRPLYLNSRSNIYSQRNIPLFFGSEIFFKL
ncbi:carboxypeptidase-like regulatory domain-containing protein [Belliella marina]|uniref:Carboxypeptidase-like regulatory domain-containing protein n=1 Tax=Belliella marina TaxID=1644146 RepID=A0ABW4VM67_9BACT